MQRMREFATCFGGLTVLGRTGVTGLTHETWRLGVAQMAWKRVGLGGDHLPLPSFLVQSPVKGRQTSLRDVRQLVLLAGFVAHAAGD